MTRFHQSLKLRIIALAAVVLIGIIVVVHSTVYVTSKRLIDDEIAKHTQGLATAIAYYLGENIEEYKAFLAFVDEFKASRGYGPSDVMREPMPREEYENNPFYRKMQAYFAYIKEHSHIRYIYTERQLCEDFLEYILDGVPIGTEYHSPPGSPDEISDSNRDAFANRQPDRWGLTYYEDWGYLIGAYAPIFDNDGNFLGLIGVDVCGDDFRSHLNKLQLILFAIYAAIVGLALAILMRFSGAMLEPLLKDKLTGAYNKRFAEKLIQDEIATAIKEHGDLALMVLDLDHFKNVNDTYGHNFGDKVLTAVSQTIQSILRQKDYFIRYGGEEFIVIFPRVNEKRAMEIAGRIRHAVEESEIYNEEKDTPVKMTISIGVASLALEPLSVFEFIDHADKALYVAKKTRNSVSFYTKEAEKLFDDSNERRIFAESAITRKEIDKK